MLSQKTDLNTSLDNDYCSTNITIALILMHGPRMCSFNAEAFMCVGDAILIVSLYILFVFLDRSSFEGLRCSICRVLSLARLYRPICARLCFVLVIRVIDFVAP
jgi:hypothetical protein